MAEQLRAIVYSRVSTDAQERDGTSLDTQERASQEYVGTSGWMLVESLKDTASGFSLDRPGIEKMRLLLRQGSVDVIVAYAVDRLSRNQNHIGVLFDEVDQAGAQLQFVTEKFEDTAIGRFILAARAFIGEVEREKIAERTMRGKAERARSGKIPQGTGKGCYGYRYNQITGKREIDEYQAVVVRQMFQRYAETRSFSAVSRELNQAGVTSLGGGRWYPITIRRQLMNECYTGRFTYRKTKRVKTRNGSIRGFTNKQVNRPADEWIEVLDACPRIIEEETWQRVQSILNDPERTKQRPTPRFYMLRGRTKCGICGSAMIGQTLTVKGRPFRYYRCRHVYDKNTSRDCTARYVRSNKLESAIWDEVQRVLADPVVVLRELEGQAELQTDVWRVTSLQDQIASLAEREERLVRLYSMGTIREEIVQKQLEEISRERTALTQQLNTLQCPVEYDTQLVDRDLLGRVCQGGTEWLKSADDADKRMALEALQVSVEATANNATLTGILPLKPPEFIKDEHTSRCLFSGEADALARLSRYSDGPSRATA